MFAQAELHLLQILKFPIFQRRRNPQEDKSSNIQTGECHKSPFSVRQGRRERHIPILKNVYCEMGRPAWNFPGSLLLFFSS
jgi:hypothetical protein